MKKFIDLISAILKDEFKLTLEELQREGQTGRIARIRRALVVILRDEFNFKYEAIAEVVNRKHPNCVIQYNTHLVALENPLRDPEYIKIYNQLSKRYKSLKDPVLMVRRIGEIDNSIHALMMERDLLRLELEFKEKKPKLYHKRIG